MTNKQDELLPGDSRKPVFGEWLRGIWASETNPIRDGMYVRTVRRTGRLNPGTYYELTNGEGKFWEFEAKDTLYLNTRPTTSDEKRLEEDAEPLSEWLITEIGAIDTRYRGSPSHDHTAYDFKCKVLEFIEKHKSVINAALSHKEEAE